MRHAAVVTALLVVAGACASPSAAHVLPLLKAREAVEAEVKATAAEHVRQGARRVEWRAGPCVRLAEHAARCETWIRVTRYPEGADEPGRVTTCTGSRTVTFRGKKTTPLRVARTKTDRRAARCSTSP